MSAGSYLDVCKFVPTAGSTTDWTVSSAVTGYQTPASAGAVNATVYSYRAESADLSQWEIGFGAYTVSGTVLARTTIVASSTGSKVSFTVAPNVAVVALTADLLNAGLFTAGTMPTARLGSGSASSTTALFGDQTYKAITTNGLVSRVAYTSTQTITIPAGATRATVYLWGASGGGGNANTGNSDGSGAAGGGAGALVAYLTGLTAGNTLALTLGAAGTAGATSATAHNNGGAGGNSTLASGTQTITTLTANGGGGGIAASDSAATAVAGGSGGTASNGDTNITGQPGAIGIGLFDGTAPTTTPATPGGMTGMGYSVGGNGAARHGGAGLAGIIGGCAIEWHS